MALNSDLARLSLDEPAQNLHSLIKMHKNIVNVLKKADATQGCASPEYPSAAHHFQHITNCNRSEALYCLNHASNGDIRSAVVIWHSQVLKEYLASQKSPTAKEREQLPPILNEHEAQEKADAMRVKAHKAAAAADSYEMKNLAHDYLRTNFCSICKVERDVAVAYMKTTNYDIVAAVEEYIAKHLRHLPQSRNADAGVPQHNVLLTRQLTPDAENNNNKRRSSDHGANKSATGSGRTASSSSVSPAAPVMPAQSQPIPPPATLTSPPVSTPPAAVSVSPVAAAASVPKVSPPVAAAAAPTSAAAGRPMPHLQPAAGLQYPTMKTAHQVQTAKTASHHAASTSNTVTPQSLQAAAILNAVSIPPMQLPTQPSGPPAGAGFMNPVQPGLSPTSSVQQYPMIGSGGGSPSSSVLNAVGSHANAAVHGPHSMGGPVQQATYPAIGKPGLPQAPSQPGDLRRRFGQRH